MAASWGKAWNPHSCITGSPLTWLRFFIALSTTWQLRLQGHMKKTETLERVKVAICKGKWEEALKKLNVLFFLFQTLFSSICMAI